MQSLVVGLAILSHGSNRKCREAYRRAESETTECWRICMMESSVHGSTDRHLSYRVVADGNRWHWEVVGANRHVLACGSAHSSVEARAAAMAAGLEFQATHRGPKEDDSSGIRQ
jgi:hypothetical protein